MTLPKPKPKPTTDESLDVLLDDRSSCRRCSRCHPGRQFGGPEWCRNPKCGCHHG